MRAKAIIFDWDGVIADSLSNHFKIYRGVEKTLGRKMLPKEDDGDFFTADWRNIFREYELNDKKLMKRISEHYLIESRQIHEKTKQFKGIVKVVKELSRNFKLGLVSNNYRELFEPKMQEWGIQGCFAAIVDGHHGTLKPDPGQIIECMKIMNVKPEETIYVGDMEGDVVAGKNAKVKIVVAVTYGWHSHKKLKLAKPDVLVKKPEELSGLKKYK